MVAECPMCSSPDLSIIVETESFGGPEIYVPVHVCNGCDFKWTDDIGGQVWDKNRALLRTYELMIKQLKNELVNVRLGNSEKCKSFEDRLVLSEAQNYCKICGGILDGYMLPVTKQTNKSNPYMDKSIQKTDHEGN